MQKYRESRVLISWPRNPKRRTVEKLKINEIRNKARDMGVTFARHTHKTELIQAIQAAEGNCSCFATPKVGSCGQEGCCWRGACLEIAGS